MRDLDTPEAKVIAVRDGSATVSVDAGTVCRRCAAGRGCGAGIFAAAQEPKLIDVTVTAGILLEVGDRVRLALAPAQLLRAAWLMYGLPLVAMVLAVLAASRTVAPGSDLVAALFATLGLVGGTVLGRRAMSRDGCLHEFVPTVFEKVNRHS